MTTARPAIAIIVFVANAGLLVLQLLASRWLVPFIGSSLETWTAIIGVFLLGIALGNAVGGRLADRYPTPRLLALFLLLGSLAALSMMVIPRLLTETNLASELPLRLRVPVLTFVECFPAGFLLSLITPMAIKLGLKDLARTGGTVGVIFALGTLGCLAGNYATGFLLIPHFTLSTITGITAACLLGTAIIALLIPRTELREYRLVETLPATIITAEPAFSIRRAAAIVFCCSFCGMALELTAARILAQVVGVSLYTWTGVIGVMLGGTAAGNWLGGRLADRGGGTRTLAATMLLAAVFAFAVLPGFYAIIELQFLRQLPLMPQILALTFALFFLPMMLLGTISPQVIKLCMVSTSSAGRTAGQVYAWSTAGAIVGTFATGYLLISSLGMYRTVLFTVVIVMLATSFVAGAWQRRWVTHTVASLLGLTLAAGIVTSPANTGITLETNYFTIRVKESPLFPGTLELRQGRLAHSYVKLDNPLYLNYFHELIQLEILSEWQTRNHRDGNVLVIGGGGYTFPRAAKTVNRNCSIDVVEIDPGVTAVSYSHLGLDPALGIKSFHMDGRQFISEVAVPGAYDIITLDAVNDLAVPYHLLTREFNATVKRALAPNGVYLVTVIDSPAGGQLWKATIHTLRQTFAHVESLTHLGEANPEATAIHMLYASDQPLNLPALLANAKARTPKPFDLYCMPATVVNAILKSDRAIILTDEYAPVDQFMSAIFRNRK